MSHFAVLVLLDHETVESSGVPETLSRALKPYLEDGTGDQEWESLYTEFNNETEEYRTEFEEDKRDPMTFSSKKMCKVFANFLPADQAQKFKDVCKSYEARVKKGVYDNKTSEKANKELVETCGLRESYTFKEVYGEEGFDQWVQHWHNLEPNAEGLYGYAHNPNAKWDWYVIGGRWANYLYQYKKGVTESDLPDSSGFGSHDLDQFQRQDLDIDKIRQHAEEQAKKFWEKFQRISDTPKDELIGDDQFWMDWEAHSTLMEAGFRKITPEADELWEKDREAFRNLKPEEKFDDIEFTYEDLDKQKMALFGWGTYAVLDARGDTNEWMAKGEMGWFGMSSDTPEESKDYRENFIDKFLDEGDPKDWLVLVDCHI